VYAMSDNSNQDTLKVNIRGMSFPDIIPLHRFYNSLSEHSKECFHPHYFRPETGLKWLLSLICLALSPQFTKFSIKKYIPKAVFLPLVATNSKDIIAFAYIKIQSRSPKNSGYLSEMGIAIKDEYQGKQIGSKMMKELMELARKEDIADIALTVNTNNINAIKLYKNYGFAIQRYLEKREYYDGKLFDIFEMKKLIKQKNI
jgi:RimJ/RimL family protein N-acetyltransferase